MSTAWVDNCKKERAQRTSFNPTTAAWSHYNNISTL